MISILLSLIILLPSWATEWSSPEEQTRAQSLPPGLIVDLRAQKQNVRLGERILFDVEVGNAGTRVIDISAIMAPQFYWVSFDVRDRHGKEVTFIGPNQKLNLTGEVVHLSPGYFWGQTFDLSKLFDLRRPGSYTVRARYTPSGTILFKGYAQIVTQEVELKVKEPGSN